jgi:hypothetical protein
MSENGEVLSDTPKRRGRPPKGAAVTVLAAKSPKKPGRSAASRQKQAAKMRAKKAAEAAPTQKRGKRAMAAGATDDAPGGT